MYGAYDGRARRKIEKARTGKLLHLLHLGVVLEKAESSTFADDSVFAVGQYRDASQLPSMNVFEKSYGLSYSTQIQLMASRTLQDYLLAACSKLNQGSRTQRLRSMHIITGHVSGPAVISQLRLKGTPGTPA